MEPEPSFIAQYYLIQNTDGSKAEREYQYFADLDAAATAYQQIPNHLNKQLGMESTEQPPSRMSLIVCRNGIETLTDIEFNSLSGKWVREEKGTFPSRPFLTVTIIRFMVRISGRLTEACTTIRICQSVRRWKRSFRMKAYRWRRVRLWIMENCR